MIKGILLAYKSSSGANSESIMGIHYLYAVIKKIHLRGKHQEHVVSIASGGRRFPDVTNWSGEELITTPLLYSPS